MLTPGGSFEGSTTSWKLSGGAKSSRQRALLHSREGRQRFALHAAGILGLDADDVFRRRRLAHALRRHAATAQAPGRRDRQQPPGTASASSTAAPSRATGRGSRRRRSALLLTNVSGLLTTKAISLRFTATERHHADRRRLPRSLQGHLELHRKTDRHAELAAGGRAAAPPGVDEGARAERRLALLRRQEADPRAQPAHDLRRGALPEHLRVLGTRHGDLPDPRRHLHARLPLLLRELRQARASAGPARAAAARADRGADGPQARRRHLGRPRRPARQGRRPLRGDHPRAQGEGARRRPSRC